jgi:hypothetical protein
MRTRGGLAICRDAGPNPKKSANHNVTVRYSSPGVSGRFRKMYDRNCGRCSRCRRCKAWAQMEHSFRRIVGRSQPVRRVLAARTAWRSRLSADNGLRLQTAAESARLATCFCSPWCRSCTVRVATERSMMLSRNEYLHYVVGIIIMIDTYYGSTRWRARWHGAMAWTIVLFLHVPVVPVLLLVST